MISKDLLLLSEQLNEFKVSHITVSIFSIILYFFTKTLGGSFIDKENNGFLVTNLANLVVDRPDKYFFNWGHDSSYIYIYIFNPSNFLKKCEIIISNPMNDAPEWLPHVRTVHGETILMYTSGKVGKSNTDNIKTKVFIRNLSKYTEENC